MSHTKDPTCRLANTPHLVALNNRPCSKLLCPVNMDGETLVLYRLSSDQTVVCVLTSKDS